MPWKYNGSTLRVGRGFVGTDGTKYPQVWMRYSTTEKADIGITWEDPSASEAPFDDRFYSGRQTDGTLIPRSLTDINDVDDDGNAILDEDGNQSVTLGLKSVWKNNTKSSAGSMLEPTDWYVVRKAEAGTAIPSTIATYRAAVRTASGNIETAIDNASDLAAFMALWTVPVDSDGEPTGKAPIYNWPDEL